MGVHHSIIEVHKSGTQPNPLLPQTVEAMNEMSQIHFSRQENTEVKVSIMHFFNTLTLTITPCVSVSHGSEPANNRIPESVALKWNSAIIHFIDMVKTAENF